MFRTRTFLTLSATAVWLMAAAPAALATEDTISSPSVEIQEAIESIKRYSIEKKNAAVDESRDLLDALDREYEHLDRSSEEAADDLKQKWAARRGELAEMREKTRLHLKQLEDSSGDAWDEIKAGFTDAVDELSRAAEEARREFES